MRKSPACIAKFGPVISWDESKRVFSRSLVALACICAGSFALAQAPSDSLLPGQSLGLYLGIDRIPNLRDLGGYKTQDNYLVVKGKAYRSNDFYGMDANDLAKFKVLKLKNDFDLRTPAEIVEQPDTVPVGVKYVELNVMSGDSALIIPAEQMNSLLMNPKLASQQLGGVEGVEASFIKLYRDLVSLRSAQNSYRTLFLSLSNPSKLPSDFHCTNGKDRTGWGAAALLTFLGVSKEEVLSDFLRSNEYLLPLHQNQTDQFIEGGGDPSIPPALFGVKQKYLEAAFDEMNWRYGSIEKYFSEGLKINTYQQQQIRKIYLTKNQKM